MRERVIGSRVLMPASGPGSRPKSRTVDKGLLTLPLPPGGLELPELPGALCKGQDPSVWFPTTGESSREAKTVCRACPVQSQCLDWALDADERTGVWGGTSPHERALIRQGGQPRPADDE